MLLKHPQVTGCHLRRLDRGRAHVYATAAAHGKRVQCSDRGQESRPGPAGRPHRGDRAAASSIRPLAARGSAAWPCPWCAWRRRSPTSWWPRSSSWRSSSSSARPGTRRTELGPLVTAEHRAFVRRGSRRPSQEGAELVLDGRGVMVRGYEGGYFLGPTIFDRVTPAMRFGWQEVFGPVLYIKRVQISRRVSPSSTPATSPTGPSIFTQSGYHAREFARRIDGGMVGINVGIPVPMSAFPFCGPQTELLRRPPRHGQGRRGLLYRDQGRHELLVFQKRPGRGAGGHVGRGSHSRVADIPCDK